MKKTFIIIGVIFAVCISFVIGLLVGQYNKAKTDLLIRKAEGTTFYAKIDSIRENNGTIHISATGLDVNNINWRGKYNFSIKESTDIVWRVCHKGGSLKAAALTKAIVQSGGVVFESAALREFNIDRAVSEYAGTVGCKLDPRAQAMLIDHIGFDLALLAKEIDKLRMTLPVGAVITPESVAENVGISKEYNNFELIAAISKRDKVKTFKIINHFRSNPKKNPTAPIASLIFNLFANVLIAYYARTTDERALMEALRMKTPYQLRDVRAAMRYYNATQALRIIACIREFDARSKGIGSNRNEYDLLEELATKIFCV